MRYEIHWEDAGCFDNDGTFETLEGAKAWLENQSVDSEMDAAAMEGREIEIQWDDDMLGFLMMSWTGPDKDEADDYFERIYRIREVDEYGDCID